MAGALPDQPAVALDVARDLVQDAYALHVRELEARLWQRLVRPPSSREVRKTPQVEAAATVAAITPERIQRCLDENNGALEATSRALGMRNRFALLRLIKRHGLEVRRRPGGAPRRSG